MEVPMKYSLNFYGHWMYLLQLPYPPVTAPGAQKLRNKQVTKNNSILYYSLTIGLKSLPT